MYHYDPLVLSFVLNLHNPALSVVKTQLVECVAKLQDDDRGYIYHPNNLDILTHSGAVVGSIANYQPLPDFQWDQAINQTVSLAETQDSDARKYIFIILDEYELNHEYRLKKGINIPTDAVFVILCVSRRCHPSLSQIGCQVIFDNPENIGKHIIKIAEI
jgi:hypothetical protein